MINEKRVNAFLEIEPVTPREAVNVEIILTGKKKRYVCRKIDIPKGVNYISKNAIFSRRYGFIVAKFDFGQTEIKKARKWLAKIRRAKRCTKQ